MTTAHPPTHPPPEDRLAAGTGGNAGPYDYCTGDPVNCTDLDGNWGMPKWLRKTVEVVAEVAYIPGPIGATAATGVRRGGRGWRRLRHLGRSRRSDGR
ncbi:hypothetical protein [Kitasatospora sp. NPDC002965]|uniref:hypothetical protein n=1 Tax=Kitasatospora sp. NPDC002965 TaxID=3154775 RepID=UPI0033B5C408